jgi:phytoene synthase
LLGEADRFYRLADAGITHLPGSCQPGIRAARLLYAEIGQEVARNGYDSLSRRAFVPARRKAWLAANALVGGTLFPARLADTLQPQGVHLLNAVATLSPTPPAHAAQAPRKRPWWDMEQRMLWLLDLFERLERRDSDERQTREPRRMPAHFASNGQPDAERA